MSREAKLSGANGDKKKIVFSVQLTTSKIGNLTRLILTLAKGDGYTYNTLPSTDTLMRYCTVVLYCTGRLIRPVFSLSETWFRVMSVGGHRFFRWV